MPRLDWRTCLLGAGVLALLALPVPAGFTRPGWELSQWAGLAAAVACLLLVVGRLRPRDAKPPTLLSLRLHTAIGWTTLALAAFHVGGLVVSDRTVLEYLKPSAPYYQILGIAAFLILTLLVIVAHGPIRRRLWQSQRAFQAFHVTLACALILGVAAHVIVTARYVGGSGRRALYVAVTAGALVALLRARLPLRGARPTSRVRVFGRHSASIVGVVVVCGAMGATLLSGAVDGSLRETPFMRATRLPLDFPHDKHGAVNCLACHHNYADGRGSELCVECHRSQRGDLREGAEARFHEFCLGCHRHPSESLPAHAHGPVSGCDRCHRVSGSA